MNTLYIDGDTCTIFLGLRMHQFYIFIVFDNFLVFRGHSRGILAMVQGGGIIRQWCHIYRSESLSQVQFILLTMLYSFPKYYEQNFVFYCFIIYISHITLHMQNHFFPLYLCQIFRGGSFPPPLKSYRETSPPPPVLRL